MNFAAALGRRKRRLDLTPMIDVVFLLLIFFLLAARFAPEDAIVLAPAGGAADWQGPPRLVDVRPDGLALNGVTLAPAALVAELARLSPDPDAPVILRPRDGASLQALVDAMALLRDAGHARLVLVE